MPRSRPVVAVSVKSYPPAFRSGGPTRSTEAIALRLSDEIDLRVITSLDDNGHDLREDGVAELQWQLRNHARVFAIPLGRRAPFRAVKQLRSVTPDVLYLNSLFNPVFTLAPLLSRRLGVLNPKRTVIAPRGELDPGALAIKAKRKQRVLELMRRLALTRDVVWHATTEEEAAHIERHFGGSANVVVAANLRTLDVQPAVRLANEEAVRLVFMSKIDRKKNLETAVAAIALCPNATLTVIGPVKDKGYWQEVRDLADSLDVADRLEYVGPVEPDLIIEPLRKFDLFILPTHGENFGHAILEALTAGVPVLLSDKTPWSHVGTAGAGWTCDPNDVPGFAARISEFAGLAENDRYAMRINAATMAEQYLNDPTPVDAHRHLFGLPRSVG